MTDTRTVARGIRVTPGDRRYAAVRRGYNPRWEAEPDYVELVRSPEEAVTALRDAVADHDPGEERSRITTRSGGHCYEDFVCAPDVRVIIDVSLMDEVYEDGGMVCVEAGATNGDLRKQLFLKTGKVLPGGSCASVGVGGHVPAGGFGLLSRQFGLTVDYLYEVEVAVVDEDREVRLVRANRDSPEPERSLWWAHTGGGGGNFGIVTRFWFRGLPDAPEHVLLTAGGWKWSSLARRERGFRQFKRIVDNFGSFFARRDPKFDPLFAILLLTHRSQPKIGLIAQIDASAPKARQRMADFQKAMGGGPRLALRSRAFEDLTEGYGEYPALAGLQRPQPLPWDSVDKLLGPVDNLRCGKHKSAYMRGPLPERQIRALWEGLAGEDRGVVRDAVVQIDSYGAAVNEVAEEATAVAQRDSVLKLQHQVYWPATEDGADHLHWIRTVYQNMYADTGGVPATREIGAGVTDGCYVGYPDVDLSDREWNIDPASWSRLYYGRHYPALQEAKRRWDPLNVFRHRQSVEPPAGVPGPRS
ncbi:FAD-binding oxidoreductase [Marinitenerispora sediminis]|uniref:Isoquinoline biosynthesis protein n=1 Tax=Marinitenerispora sediminis TaxID=1931232 RepID=A0A368T626_9ACTN|nr:FAD-binding oxidoreductase [Marinitenerispora sediminis]RCV51730.1 isoquinoline biosynthesis protein [Marinitenerispora sediminis]RCV55112.1 isoquinoline biosynthesis protein [Marinitenerispora sediminis]RCV59100.1 isoquinoline biosynthesis protein [Marinitenerispora sediminis]